MKKIIKIFVILFILWISSILLINLYVLSFSKSKIITTTSIDLDYGVWIVFGAKVKDNWTPSDILKDRLKVTYDAYSNNLVSKIIVSWDNSRTDYDETTAMRDYLIELWVNKDDIYMDYAWFDTYDTLYRAKDIFWVEKAVLFTQTFHLKRALYISNRIWIDSIWVSTDLRDYIYSDYYNRREALARVKAFLNVEILKSKPKYLWDKIDLNIPQTEISELNIYN